MIGRTNVSGGGLNINGLLNDFIASENIGAGKFVEFVGNKESSYNTSTTSSNSVNIAAVELNENKVLLLYNYYNGAKVHLYGQIVSFNGTSIVLSTKTDIADIGYYSGSNTMYITKINENKVFVSYVLYNNNYTSFYYGMFVSINNDTISIINNGNVGKLFRAINIGNNKFFGISADRKAYLVSFENDEVSFSSETTITTYDKVSDFILVSENKILVTIVRTGSSAGYIYGAIVTISGNTISKSSDIIIYNNSSSSTPSYTYISTSLVKINDTDIFVAFTYFSYQSSSWKYYLEGCIIRISGTSFTKYKSNFSINTSYNYSGYMFKAIKLCPKAVAIIYYAYNTDYRLYAGFFRLQEQNTKMFSQLELSTEGNYSQITSVEYANNGCFAFDVHKNSNSTYYTIGINLVNAKVKETALYNIDGVSNKSASSGNNVGVYLSEVVS